MSQSPKNMLKAVRTGEGVEVPKVEFFDTPPLMVAIEMLAKAFRDAELPAPPIDMWKRHQSLDFYLGMYSAMRVSLIGCQNILIKGGATPQTYIDELQFLNGQLANIIEEKNKSKIILEP